MLNEPLHATERDLPDVIRDILEIDFDPITGEHFYLAWVEWQVTG